MIGKWLNALRDRLIGSSVVHVRGAPPASTTELVELFDRFLEGRPLYGLEWDDFISWPSEEPQIEAVRERLGEYGRLLFSASLEDPKAYAAQVLQERNQLARLIGRGVRPSG